MAWDDRLQAIPHKDKTKLNQHNPRVLNKKHRVTVFEGRYFNHSPAVRKTTSLPQLLQSPSHGHSPKNELQHSNVIPNESHRSINSGGRSRKTPLHSRVLRKINGLVGRSNSVEALNTKTTSLLEYVSDNVIGKNKTIHGPFGPKKSLYCDYTASGRALQFIEDYIQDHVLPAYANTHVSSTDSAMQTTVFREGARNIVKNSVNAKEQDVVIFTGSGCTAAVHKLILALQFQEKPIIFCGPFEHHSNILPWRELGDVIIIQETEDGQVDIEHLKHELEMFKDCGRPLIGTFGAASNVTGVLLDVNKVTVLLHKYGALSFWDYATAAPYIGIDMNPLVSGKDQPYVHKDAIFISPHKFIGGVQTPGILVAKRKLFTNPVPTSCGGGTVSFVNKKRHRYYDDIETREEGGTPAIVESVRAGLVFQLKDAISTNVILERDNQLCRKAMDYFKEIPNLILLGPFDVHRLPIFSIMVKHKESGHFLHYKFLSTLLNDVFGIQSRGGCACAGPYGMELLDISESLASDIEESLSVKGEILKPGYVRLNLPFFVDDETIDFILEAVKIVAQHGWKMLPQYIYDDATREWRHYTQPVVETKELNHISYDKGYMNLKLPKLDLFSNGRSQTPETLQECLESAKKLFASCKRKKLELDEQSLVFDDKSNSIRWFLIPTEAYMCLHNSHFAKHKRWKKVPFEPKVYPSTKDDRQSWNKCQCQVMKKTVPNCKIHSKKTKTSSQNKENRVSVLQPETNQVISIKRKERTPLILI